MTIACIYIFLRNRGKKKSQATCQSSAPRYKAVLLYTQNVFVGNAGDGEHVADAHHPHDFKHFGIASWVPKVHTVANDSDAFLCVFSKLRRSALRHHNHLHHIQWSFCFIQDLVGGIHSHVFCKNIWQTRTKVLWIQSKQPSFVPLNFQDCSTIETIWRRFRSGRLAYAVSSTMMQRQDQRSLRSQSFYQFIFISHPLFWCSNATCC